MTRTKFIPYDSSYFSTCLEIFKKNIPDFFHEDEIVEFIEYLKSYAEGQYWVCETEGHVIGAGGIRVFEGAGRLVYGFIDPAYHRQGFGRELLNFRLQKLSEIPDIRTIKIDTTPQSSGFFKHCGFIEDRIIRNGISEGLDMVDMSLKL